MPKRIEDEFKDLTDPHMKARLRAVRDGFCPRCKKNPPAAECYAYCQNCLDYAKIKTRERETRRAIDAFKSKSVGPDAGASVPGPDMGHAGKG